MNQESTMLNRPDIARITDDLCSSNGYSKLFFRQNHHRSMPSVQRLEELMDRLRDCLFPGFFSKSGKDKEVLKHHVAANLDIIHDLLSDQIACGICFSCAENTDDFCCKDRAEKLATQFMNKLPEIRSLLASDVIAAYEGDPAARSTAETIFCYPSIYVMTHHRIAHALYQLDVPIIPRIISEQAHSKTGIDIHPGASVGEKFFIDHGTGVVIGETCIVGSGCTLYQGVTLGALSFPKDSDGKPVKGMPRHPVLGNNVIVYAGATILGRVTIGDDCVIGGNTWLTQNLPAGSKISQKL